MTLYVITGPPTAGKTTWVREHAKPGDITIDYDALVNALHIVDVAQTARNAAIHVALNKLWHCHVYIIDSQPNDEARQRYERLDAQFIHIDPGHQVCAARAQAERHPRIQQAVDHWYGSHVAP